MTTPAQPGRSLSPPNSDLIPGQIQSAARLVRQAGGSLFLVGGSVRDMLLGIEPKDWDCEVFGIEEPLLERLLAHHFNNQVEKIGKAFGVWACHINFGVWACHINGCVIEIALPRRERKTKDGHRGFDITSDPHMALGEAAIRRDLTINALYYELGPGTIHDPTGHGLGDLGNKYARPTSYRFKEDPLRVLRAMQFIGRFDLEATPGLIQYSKEVRDEFHTLSSERVWSEWDKFLTKSPKFGRALGS